MSKFGNLGFGAVAICAGLGYYVASYSVAAERERIEDIEQQIEADEDSIARLQAELGVRASLTRLEDINARVWNLKAPAPEQIIGGRVQLASWLAPEADVRLEYAMVEDAPRRASAPQPIVLADAAPEVPVPVAVSFPETAAAETVGNMDAKRVVASLVMPKPADLFSTDFINEVETAATLERAGFQKVGLR